ncbi:hypothetical protein GXW82_24200 [Streptacidiphilus sp. 4-A2]|nr:hypothetical protein [Streptacidiphilus sp. 4-A2]
MRQARTEFVGGPLDGRRRPVAVNLAERIPAEFLVELPARGDGPARIAVYHREAVFGADGRRRWRYVFVS